MKSIFQVVIVFEKQMMKLWSCQGPLQDHQNMTFKSLYLRACALDQFKNSTIKLAITKNGGWQNFRKFRSWESGVHIEDWSDIKF